MNEKSVEQLNNEEIKKSIFSEMIKIVYDADAISLSLVAQELRRSIYTDQLSSFNN